MIRLLLMLNLTYHLSETIQENLKEIDKLRTKILLTPISPKQEMKLRYEANISKSYWALTLADNPLTKAQIVKLLDNPLPKKLTDPQKEIVGYLNALSYIYNYWSGQNKQITTRTVLDLYDLSCKKVFGSTLTYYKSKVNEVEKILNFTQSGNDNPIIKAGLIQIEIIKLSPFENGTGRVARLLSHLLLSQHAYDLRGLLVIEDYYRNDLVSLKEAVSSIEKNKNATIWLEYFTEGIKAGMDLVKNTLENKGLEPIKQSGWRLTERQGKILEKLENPDLKITNKLVQKAFGVSQITASRDLSKMANLGILLPHGKGRSIFYTKV